MNEEMEKKIDELYTRLLSITADTIIDLEIIDKYIPVSTSLFERGDYNVLSIQIKYVVGRRILDVLKWKLEQEKDEITKYLGEIEEKLANLSGNEQDVV